MALGDFFSVRVGFDGLCVGCGFSRGSRINGQSSHGSGLMEKAVTLAVVAKLMESMASVVAEAVTTEGWDCILPSKKVVFLP